MKIFRKLHPWFLLCNVIIELLKAAVTRSSQLMQLKRVHERWVWSSICTGNGLGVTIFVTTILIYYEKLLTNFILTDFLFWNMAWKTFLLLTRAFTVKNGGRQIIYFWLPKCSIYEVRNKKYIVYNILYSL